MGWHFFRKANQFVPPKIIKEILLRASNDEHIDIHVLVFLIYHYIAQRKVMGATSLHSFIPVQELAEVCKEVKESTGKPVILVMPNYRQEEDAMELEEIVRETRELFLKVGVPVYDDVRNALKVVSLVSRYAYYKNNIVNANDERMMK